MGNTDNLEHLPKNMFISLFRGSYVAVELSVFSSMAATSRGRDPSIFRNIMIEKSASCSFPSYLLGSWENKAYLCEYRNSEVIIKPVSWTRD